MPDIDRFLGIDDDEDARSSDTLFIEHSVEIWEVTPEGIAADTEIQYGQWDEQHEPIFEIWKAMIGSTQGDRQPEEKLNEEQKARHNELKKQWEKVLVSLTKAPPLLSILETTLQEHGYPWKNKLEDKGGAAWSERLTYIIMKRRGQLLWAFKGAFFSEGKKGDEFYDVIRSLLSKKVYDDSTDWGTDAEAAFSRARALLDGPEPRAKEVK